MERAEQALERLLALESRIADEVRANLGARKSGRWSDSDDKIFAPHTEFVRFTHEKGLAERPIKVWLNGIQPHVVAADTDPRKPIHCGAPLYNTGLCYFLLGDFDRASQFIAEAGDADQRAGRGASRLRTGGGLSQQVLLEPLDSWSSNEFGGDYAAATTRSLSGTELQNLVGFLERRTSDAVVLLSALHRVKSQMSGFDNDAARLHRVRALADLLVVLESSLGRWQGSTDTLGGLCGTLVARTTVGTVFGTRDRLYAGRDLRLPQEVNTMIAQELAAFDSASSVAERAAISLYLSYRLRNALLHTLDGSLVLYGGGMELRRGVALALASIELSRLGEAGQLGSL